MKSKRSNRLLVVISLSGLSCLPASGCESTDAPSACATPSAISPATGRMVLGETAWLPATSVGCTGAWTIDTAPDGGVASVVIGDDGFARFTPTTPGRWSLRVEGARDAVSLDVSAWDPTSFVHFNYYPSRSLATVGDELWVANTFAPTITRLDAGGVRLGAIDVGPWPVAIAHAAGSPVALVAQRGGDTVGVVDVQAGRLVDAIWVGDEPANIIVSQDGATAWVALATDDAVAEIDVAGRRLRRTIPVVKDPLAMALSADGNTLWVASYRSGQADRAPFGADSLEAERDLAAVDVATGEVRYLTDVGHTITAILPAPGDERIWVAHTRGDPFADFVNPPEGRAAFRHEVMVVDATSGAVEAVADLGRDPGTGGPVVVLRELVLHDGLLYVTSEGTDEVLALDPTTLTEQWRVSAAGRPRALLAHAGSLYAHGAQAWQVTRIDGEGGTTSLSTGVETRPALLAEGQRFFTGAGDTYGIHWSCNTCHVDGGTDTMIWKAGPFESRHTARPLFWLEATAPLGWDGYSASARNFAHTGPVNIGVKATREEADALTAYLESLVPPPAATSLTERNGEMSELAAVGEAVFAEAGCAVCHGGTLATNKALLDDGITAGLSDVPSLVGVRRHVVWLKHGDVASLEGAVEAAVEAFAPAPLAPDDLDALTRFVAEMGPRDFAPIATEPARNERHAAVDRPVRLILTAPVDSAPDNLARVSLVADDGAVVPAAVTGAGRYVTLIPEAPLAYGARYTISIAEGFQALDGRRAASVSWDFDTAAAPAMRLDGEYRWVVDVPFPDFAAGRFDNSRTVAVTTPATATAGAINGTLRFDFGDGLTYDAALVFDGATLRAPGVPVPAGTALGDSRVFEGQMQDADGDGLADTVEGTLTLTGPGFVVEDVSWRLVRPTVTTGCDEGPGGDFPVTITFDGTGLPVIAWDPELGNALAVYITDPGATLPLLPGQTVQDADTYWAAASTAFPAGFPGPVTWGVLPADARDATAENGGPEGGAEPEAGRCYQFSVTTNTFETGFRVLRMPER